LKIVIKVKKNRIEALDGCYSQYSEEFESAADEKILLEMTPADSYDL
jgi:hypothetical protein